MTALFYRDTPHPVSLYANHTNCFNLSAIYKSCKHYKFVIGPVFELINTPNQSLIKVYTNDVNNWNVICFHFRSQLLLLICGLTSHSAIFQLYSDGTDVQFPNFDVLPGTHAMDSWWSLACRAYLLAIRGPTRGEGKRGIEPGSSDPKSSPLPLRHRGGIEVNCLKTKLELDAHRI